MKDQDEKMTMLKVGVVAWVLPGTFSFFRAFLASKVIKTGLADLVAKKWAKSVLEFRSRNISNKRLGSLFNQLGEVLLLTRCAKFSGSIFTG